MRDRKRHQKGLEAPHIYKSSQRRTHPTARLHRSNVARSPCLCADLGEDRGIKSREETFSGPSAGTPLQTQNGPLVPNADFGHESLPRFLPRAFRGLFAQLLDFLWWRVESVTSLMVRRLMRGWTHVFRRVFRQPSADLPRC